MERNGIKQLLEKFYNGESSPDEEAALKEFFRQPSIPEELEVDRELFLYTSQASNAQIESPLLEQKIAAWVDQQEGSEAKTRKFRVWNSFIGIAASIAIIVACYFTLFQKERKMKDTYTNPQLAYAETKRTLLYISRMLNKGTAPLANIDRINQGMDQLSSFSSINDGLENLGLVSKYYNQPAEKSNKTK